MRRTRIGGSCVLLVMMTALALPPVAIPQEISSELADASLESLMNMQVTSVSRRQEELRSTSAAVYVITSDDIRRSGVTDIAELFRMVPGMNVAQSNSSVWAISARGFNAQYSTKLLVAIDGRSIYDRSFSGVYWNLQNLILEDIDRIEVIRGPGATMWGSNAVNGVISITTKKASDTRGGLFVADSGMGRPGEGSLRVGESIGKNVFYRVSARQTTRSNLLTKFHNNGGDSWNSTDLDSRLDWNPSTKNSFTFEIGRYRGVAGSTARIIQSVSPLTIQAAGLMGTTGSHILGRWNRTVNSTSNLTIQVYYDDNSRTGNGEKDTDTVDFDLQHDFRIGDRQRIMWGFGHREIHNVAADTVSFGVTPARKFTNQSNAFVQDDITAIDGKLIVSVGAKFERSAFTGNSIQPSLHVLWLPTSRQSIWVASSRAIRTTNIIERGIHISLTPFDAGFGTGIVELFGQENTKSEALMAYEAGYRYQAGRKFWIDLATFYNSYQDLSTTIEGAPFFTTGPAPQFVAPLYFANTMGGETYGTEVSANYRASSIFTLRGSYSLLRMQMHADPGTPVKVESLEGQSPRHQAHVESHLNLPKSFEFTSHAYFVSSLRSFQIPRYTRIDMNITWKGLRRSELSLIAQNLQGSHQEFDVTPVVSSMIGRSIFGRVTWRF